MRELLGSGGGVGTSGALMVSGGLVEGALAVWAAKYVDGVEAVFLPVLTALVFLLHLLVAGICVGQCGFHPSTPSA